MTSRGIGQDAIGSYQLGMVDGSNSDHANYQGMISIPYITKLGGTVSIKLRQPHDCGEYGCGHSKYIGPYPTRPYNTMAMCEADRTGVIALCEGELNAITLHHYCGIPAVGIPGIETWTQHKEWPEMFRGYPVVLMFPDWDKPSDRYPDAGGPGEALAQLVLKQIDTARLVRLPDGMDANGAYVTIGADEIRRLAGV